MPTSNVGVSLDAGGVSINKTFSRSGDSAIGYDPTLPIGYAGTLSTRTDAETGTCTLGAGHGISTSDVVDIYWTGGVRYGVTVGTVSGTSVPIGADDSGSGDDLPAQDTAVIVATQVTVNVQIDGDNLSVLAALLETSETTARGHVDFQSSSPASIEAVELAANVPELWDITGGATNVFTGDPIVTLKASQSGVASAATLKICGLQDATP